MELLLLSIAIVVLLVLRVPVAFAFLGPSLGYMWLTDQSVGLALRLIINATASFPCWPSRSSCCWVSSPTGVASPTGSSTSPSPCWAGSAAGWATSASGSAWVSRG
ncbi:hypothetical protein [Blastococcus brunescens]|uniref:Uncharacterized protein n=1 Tax=Blastococcus brunescens TaxID=1564165 RepID=A0ABZ1B902_9ACTN|nr:hypothetical protein [Blastococcus sp. BMG 8361]WRL67287.1 hypothetical protein U6N30_18675 [Blastococcus sp. BMG 8361]